MKFNLTVRILFFLLISLGLSAQHYVKAENGHFVYQNQPYYFVGTNYWYGSFLGLNKNPEKGIKRLQRELDFLKEKGITNLRVLVGVEGSGKINGATRVQPAWQYEAGKFNDENLKGLDVFMDEIAKRNMKAVLFLSNNWEWSGGWLQYLRWNNRIDQETFQRVMNWDELRDETSKFYTCGECIAQYQTQVKRIVERKNSVNGKKYRKDKSLMAWEIANEPRPMRATAIDAYRRFISSTAALLKKLDRKHLVTTGSEGEMGSENMKVFKQVHADKNIDYLTIHIWPKNWGWLDVNDMKGTFAKLKENTIQYISSHEKAAAELKKPLVLEEFGLPRDGHVFQPGTPTALRDEYFETILDLWKISRDHKGNFAGVNFWAYNGEAIPVSGQTYWKHGDDYMGDPPMEEQGLNGVYNSDVSTWKIIQKYSKSN